MDKQIDNMAKKQKSMYISIYITQIACVTTLLIAVLIIKFFFDSSYQKLEKWFVENLFEQTVVTTFLPEEETE